MAYTSLTPLPSAIFLLYLITDTTVWFLFSCCYILSYWYHLNRISTAEEGTNGVFMIFVLFLICFRLDLLTNTHNETLKLHILLKERILVIEFIIFKLNILLLKMLTLTTTDNKDNDKYNSQYTND
jgi:hypothetical protein